MRTRITNLEPEDPRRTVGVDGNALRPELVAAVRQLLGGLGDNATRIRALLRESKIEERDLDAWTRAAINGLRQFVALTTPRAGRLPFVLVGSLTDERSHDDRIRQPIDDDDGGRVRIA